MLGGQTEPTNTFTVALRYDPIPVRALEITKAPQHQSVHEGSNVTFTVDPAAATFETLVDHGLAAGTQKKGSIDGLFDLRALNALLEKSGAYYALDGERIGQGRERAVEWLRANPQPFERLVARLKEPGAPVVAVAG